jgi:hypothetical protein
MDQANEKTGSMALQRMERVAALYRRAGLAEQGSRFGAAAGPASLLARALGATGDDTLGEALTKLRDDMAILRAASGSQAVDEEDIAEALTAFEMRVDVLAEMHARLLAAAVEVDQ